MKEKIVHSTTGITILGGGQVDGPQIRRALALAPYLLAADIGATHALDLGLQPDAVIGDMDSSNDLQDRLPKVPVFKISEQTSTDFEKCLYSLTAPFVLALGVTGSRLDHSMAAMNALACYPDLPVVIISAGDLVFLAPQKMVLRLPVGSRVSLFPMGDCQGESAGLEWPIKGLQFSPMGRIGTSNRTAAPVVTLRFEHRNMLVILSAGHLRAVLMALGCLPD